MKKAQIEIVGLSVIVIILAVGLVTALLFILRPETKILQDQRQSIRATALLNAFIDTNTELSYNNDETIKDLIINCYPDENKCKLILHDILNKIFNNQNYILKIKQFNNEITISNPENLRECLGDQIVTDPVVIQAAPKLETLLIICSPEF